MHASAGLSAPPVLQEVSLRIRRGEKVLLSGPNGSGKSTLAYLVAGLVEATGGDVLLPNRRRVSALLLPFGFVPGTVRDNISYERLSSARRAVADDLAARFGLAGRLDQDPVNFSQGEQRKCQVLMTLLKEADFYVFDEPLSNVDPESKAAIMDAILTMTRGCGLLVILHGDGSFKPLFDTALDIRHLARSHRDHSVDGAPV